MSAYVDGLRSRDKEVVGHEAYGLVNPTAALKLLETRGIETPISGDLTTLFRAAAASFYIEDGEFYG
jgi:hypothetical protein